MIIVFTPLVPCPFYALDPLFLFYELFDTPHLHQA